MEKRKIRIELSKRGIPCLWEDGGGHSININANRVGAK